ncbi:MAG: cytochrome c oxidase subunit 3 family protein [Desulfuromonadales bacterium]|nr:cytochrome c oxidase subunit 3 family protein [Desulfuromonadales bacterium]
MTPHLHKDYVGAKFGMWLFLFTELILFGGLFILYAVYLSRYPAAFIAAGAELDLRFGAANTLILLTSSLFVALSITALRLGKTRQSLWLLAATVASALLFLVNKFFEWSAKIQHGLYPASPELQAREIGETVYFNLYYLTTGLHGLHVLIGAVVIVWVMVFIRQQKVHRDDWVILENAGLYWHLVDLIWIFLFPLYYLVL